MTSRAYSLQQIDVIWYLSNQPPLLSIVTMPTAQCLIRILALIVFLIVTFLESGEYRIPIFLFLFFTTWILLCFDFIRSCFKHFNCYPSSENRRINYNDRLPIDDTNTQYVIFPLLPVNIQITSTVPRTIQPLISADTSLTIPETDQPPKYEFPPKYDESIRCNRVNIYWA